MRRPPIPINGQFRPSVVRSPNVRHESKTEVRVQALTPGDNSCELGLGFAGAKRLQTLYFPAPYRNRAVQSLGERRPKENRRAGIPGRAVKRFCPKSPQFLGFWARSEPAENVVGEGIGGGRGPGIQPSPCAGKTGRWLRMRVPYVEGLAVHGGDKTGHWSVGDVLMRAE